MAVFFDLDDKEVKLFRQKKIPKKVKTAYAKKISKIAQEEADKGLNGAFKTSIDIKANGFEYEKSNKTEKTVQTKKSSEKEKISDKSPAEERRGKKGSTSKKSKSKEKSDKAGKKDKQTSLFNF